MKKQALSILLAFALLFALLPPITPLAGATNSSGNSMSIPEDAACFNGHYYLLYNDASSFDVAQQNCVARGGHLATLTTSSENSFCYNYIVSKNVKSAYFGFTDAEKEGVWKWITGETTSYTNWHSGEPNGENSREDYAMFYYKFTDGTWNDGDFGGSTVNGGTYYICEWDGDGKNVPSWYNFFEDSYQFRNYSTTIGNQYFETLYGKGKGTAFDLWRRNAQQGGVCFGMTYTTASMLNGYPQCDNIRGLINASDGLFSVSSSVKIGNKTISIRDYINYAHIYQFSSEFQEKSRWTDIDTIFNLVKSRLESNSIGITIGMTRRDGTGGHRVLAVGIDGDDILIDDPNNTAGFERIIRGDYGSWEFTGLDGWNNITCKLRYSTDFSRPYNLLLTGSTVTTDSSSTDADSYVYGMDQLDSELFLLTVSDEDFSTDSEKLTEIVLDDYSTNSTDSTKLYWVNGNAGITISGGNTGSNFSLAGNDTIVSAKTSDASNVFLTADGSGSPFATIDAVTGQHYSLGITSFDTSGNAIEITVSGTASCEAVSVQKTDTGIVVNGMNCINVEYSDCENVIDRTFVPVNDGREITIKVDEDKEEVSTNFVVVSPFSDVKAKKYYFNPVIWAYYHDPQITSGTSDTTFSPNDTCTRGQIVTFLWRSAGSPEPETKNNPFTDVKSGKYYYKPVLWALEKGITSGTSDTTFGPDDGCTREQVVTFLWRYAGSPEPASTTNPFSDVKSGKYYYKAVLWAAENNITSGTSDTTFSPDDTCTRGQIVTFLYRYMVE